MRSRRFLGKQVVVLAGTLLVLAGMASSALAAASIVLSKHDLSTGNNTGNTQFASVFGTDNAGFVTLITEVCVFCHTPHNASTDAANGINHTLWNRTASAAGNNFTMYSSNTMSATVSSKPTGVSMMCMSCHDGVTSVGVGLLNSPGPGNPPVAVDPFSAMPGTGRMGDVLDGSWPFGYGANIGEVTTPFTASVNLANDHPISFEWPLNATDLYATPQDPSLRLFGASKKRMECATCHTVHDSTNPPFLAMSNASSNMCRACHIK